MNELKIFEYGNAEIEVITLGGEIYFNPYHVGAALNIKPTTVRDYLAAMSEKQAILLTNSDVGLTDIRKLNNAGEKFLTESGVYKLVFKSRKPEAERFTDWLAEEVLPSIRKTGSYNAPKSFCEIFIQQMDVAERFAKLTSVNVDIAASVAISEAEKLTGEDLSAWKKILPARDSDKPVAELNATQVGKALGLNAKEANQHLAMLGLQHKANKAWRLTDKGKKYGEEFPFTRNGHSDYRILWRRNVTDLNVAI